MSDSASKADETSLVGRLSAGRELSPLSDEETIELSKGLQALALEGRPLIRRLLRDSPAPTFRPYGETLKVLPKALEMLESQRDEVIVALLGQFDRMARSHHRRVEASEPTRAPGSYFDLFFLLPVAKPLTDEGLVRVAGYALSAESDVRAKALEILEGTRFHPQVIDMVFHSAEAYGIGATTLVSFIDHEAVHSRLLKALSSTSESGLRAVAIRVFEILGAGSGGGAEAALLALAHRDGATQWPAMRALGRVAPHSPRVRGLALRLIHAENMAVRSAALKALANFNDSEVVLALIGELSDEGDGQDFQNSRDARGILQTRTLSAEDALAPLLVAFRYAMAERDEVQLSEDIEYESAHGEAADHAGTGTTPGTFVPDLCMSIAELIAKFGRAARVAVPMFEMFLDRPYVKAAEDREQFLALVRSIRDA